ncbi:MAG TPA: hypothetical protein PKD90_00710 [Phnomibacter sp.]|nr:hypothetical protein [Phnomibacter sp.]
MAKAAIKKANDGYEAEQHLMRLSVLFAVTGKQVYAHKAAEWASVSLSDNIVLLNPLVKGLTRAALLRALATAYDLCYSEWQPTLQQQVSKTLFETARSVHTTMGLEANYALESNWMGVRYAVAMYALMVSDFKGMSAGTRNEANALEWDIRERLRDHIKANMNPNGWSRESLGYHYYSWSFIAPALMAYENSEVGRGKALAMISPSCLNAVATHATMVAYVKGQEPYRAVKPDFSDDNIEVRPEFFMQAFRLYPPEVHGALRWVVDAMGDRDSEESLFYRLAWYPDDIPVVNPAQLGWCQAVEEAQGAIAFRNRFKDGHDIIAAFTTTAKRIRAHQSGDNLSFRIIALDNIWVVGGGRTGLRAGQPTVFPTEQVSLADKYVSGATGSFLLYGFEKQGGGYAIGKGSCMGVTNHERMFRADYDTASGATAVFVVHDRSDNGKLWRLTTPEWNRVKALPDGFVLTGPNGATLRATVVKNKREVQVKTSTVAYNGTTTENASGIPYYGKRYPNITAVDVIMDQEIIVVLTLQPSGKMHPAVSLGSDGAIVVGNKRFQKTAWQ